MPANIKFSLLAPAVEAVEAKPRPVPRASDIVFNARPKAALGVGRAVRRQMREKRKDVSESQADQMQQLDGNGKRHRSVLDMLVRNSVSEEKSEGDIQQPQQPRNTIGDKDAYIKEVTQDCTRRLKDHGPWILPPRPTAVVAEINAERERNGECLLDALDLLSLCTRPSIFVWDPAAMFPELKILCPTCGSLASRSNWCQPRTLHQLHGNSSYITIRYRCFTCVAKPKKASPKGRRMTYFLADAPAVLASFPKYVSSLWHFVNTGRNLYDAPTIDLIRSMATKTSWCAIAGAMNEMKRAAWKREVEIPYVHLCQAMHVAPHAEPSTFPSELRVTDTCIKNLFMMDFASRAKALEEEFAKAVGDDVLRLDWPHSAAARCGGKHLLNIMDGRGYILSSRLTPTSKPLAARDSLEDLLRRGAHPKVAFVDDECCGAWRSVLQAVWPGIHVRLDCMHAIRRLAQTTTSTQHPWHGKFCAQLSMAILEPDETLLRRLNLAWARDHTYQRLPESIERKCVARRIREPLEIVTRVEQVLNDLQMAPESSGPLLTDATHSAWRNLKAHVLRGCLQDPPGMNMHLDTKIVTVGGECFHCLTSLRGTSPVEGLHAHQKQWLGAFAHHGSDVGEALLKDGACSWNRAKRARALAVTRPPGMASARDSESDQDLAA